MKRTAKFNIRLLKILFGAGLFVILCIAGFLLKHNKELAHSMEMVKHTYEVTLELKELLSNLRNAETSERGFLLAKDSLFLNSYRYRKSEVTSSINKLTELTQDNAAQQVRLENLKVLVAERLNYLSESLSDNDLNNLDSDFIKGRFTESATKMDSIRSNITEMIEV
ncbi:CHASE3 domain-containing protein, partial [Psychroserpens sp.]|uniref:CHASE3 domain-containing protein n=1 Tax=Psychroserpens sp. TaxID=2020870 RepID=UPI003C752943